MAFTDISFCLTVFSTLFYITLVTYSVAVNVAGYQEKRMPIGTSFSI